MLNGQGLALKLLFFLISGRLLQWLSDFLPSHKHKLRQINWDDSYTQICIMLIRKSTYIMQFTSSLFPA